MYGKQLNVRYQKRSFRIRGKVLGFIILGAFFLTTMVLAAGGDQVTFREIAGPGDGEDGLEYRRVPSLADDFWTMTESNGSLDLFSEAPFSPLKSRGAPGVALFDFDNDSDLDIYVTNGPGAGNSLFSNQLNETGSLSFIDVAFTAGVAAVNLDSSGVCYGDTDNDGDKDLFVLSNYSANRFFENQGDGTFLDISAASGLGNDVKSSVSCSFGDVDGDGLLDVVVANTWEDMSQQTPIFSEPYELNEHNLLFMNRGDNSFVEEGERRGLHQLAAHPPGLASITWAIAMVDYDQDGDVDILQADDQGGIPLERDGGLNRGFTQLFENDGAGNFHNVTVDRRLLNVGAWMGLSFGDLNADGHLDVFVTSLGDWANTVVSPLDPVYGSFFNYQLGDMTSRWFLGSENGFSDPGVGEIVATPFGWGTSMSDYDNDGDVDIFYHGGLQPGGIVQTAPGAILRNDGTGQLERDAVALAGSTDHELRTVHGMAMGDLDQNGFVDIVSVSNFDLEPDAPLATYNHEWGSPFDRGRYAQYFLPSETPFVLDYNEDIELQDGTLSVELNNGENGNGSLKVTLMGSIGITTGGGVNRDGIGAVIRVTPSGGQPALKPVLGGSSYASQDELGAHFGLGSARRAQIDVLWPGGTRNRLYRAVRGEELIFPEIPCSIDGDWPSFGDYKACVKSSLDELRDAGILDARQRARFKASAFQAFEQNEKR